MYSTFVLDLLQERSVIHFKTKIKLLKNDSFKKIDMATLDYPTWFVVTTKHGIKSHPINWIPEDRFFNMIRWRCLTETLGFAGLVEIYPP